VAALGRARSAAGIDDAAFTTLNVGESARLWAADRRPTKGHNLRRCARRSGQRTCATRSWSPTFFSDLCGVRSLHVALALKA